ncbi:MAG: bifunctional diaminohydroxyphosphoribosylaminopyrimidine deaminase/5-amino-6-(5-phosphoribosylamino)uracil reductase RibD [Desulfobacterales bacterium]
MNRDLFYMRMALDLAARGAGATSPNPMVGAVVVKNGKVLGKGFHARAGSPHAEVLALGEAGDRARAADLYVTLEPCNHTGRTPPCTQAILRAGIRRVVSAMADPNPNVSGGGHRTLAENGIVVETGVCGDEARRLNEAFITFVRTGKPLVTLKMAATLDGRIATRTGDSKWVTGAASRRFVHRLRHEVDAILVGVGTVRIDDPRLTTRLDGQVGSDPMRIILDTGLSIPEDARLLHQASSARTLIVTGPEPPQAKRSRIEATGAEIMSVETDAQGIRLGLLMQRLGEIGITSLLIEGGSRVAASALSAGIVHRLFLFFAPKLLGGDDGAPLFKGKGAEWMRDALRVTEVKLHRLDEDILVEGRVGKPLESVDN